MVTFDSQMRHGEASGKLRPEQATKIRKEAKVYTNTMYYDPEYIKGIATVYRKEFSGKESDSLLTFSKSNLGKQLLRKSPRLFQSGANIGKRLAIKYQQKFRMKVLAIINETKRCKTL